MFLRSILVFLFFACSYSAADADHLMSVTPQQLPSTLPSFALNTYHVQGNTRLRTPSGDLLAIRGVTMFDYLFVSNEFRGYANGAPTNQLYRQIRNPAGKGPGTGISEPTYYASVQYINHANVLAQLTAAKNVGVNLIRVGVEPAMMLASVSYTDAYNGNTYPSDFAMLDDIVATATGLGVIVELTQGDDAVAQADNVTFMAALAVRYGSNSQVWINPGNEINSAPYQTSSSTTVTNPSFGDPNAWATKETAYINALRSNGYKNPIVLDVPNYSTALNSVFTIITGTTPFSNDGNIVYGIHAYSVPLSGSGSTLVVQNTFQNGGLLAYSYTAWAQYIGKLPIFVEETGINNNLGGGATYDPALGTSQSATAEAQMEAWTKDFLTWAKANSSAGLSGVMGTMWYGYLPGLSTYDKNTMLLTNGSLSAWGAIVQKYLLAVPPISTADSGVFGSYGFRNYLINADLNVNQRVFAGGSLTAGAFGYDRWFTPSGATTSISVAASSTSASSTWSLNGTIRQVIENPNFACKTVTVSVDDPSGPVSVTLNNASGSFSATATFSAGSGKQATSFFVPCAATGNIGFTLATTATTTFSHPQVETGGLPTGDDIRPLSVELALAKRYYQKSYSQNVAPGTSSSPNGEEYVTYGPVAAGKLTGSSTVKFTVTMARSPDIVLYSPSTGATAKAYESTSGADVSSSVSVASDGSFFWTGQSSSSAATTLSLAEQWSANAEITS